MESKEAEVKEEPTKDVEEEKVEDKISPSPVVSLDGGNFGGAIALPKKAKPGISLVSNAVATVLDQKTAGPGEKISEDQPPPSPSATAKPKGAEKGKAKQKAKARKDHHTAPPAIKPVQFDPDRVMAEAAADMGQKEFGMAADKFLSVRSHFLETVGIQDCRVHLLTYAIAHCTVEDQNATVVKLGKALRLVEEISSFAQQFPLIYLSDALICQRLNIFDKAMDPLRCARKLLDRIASCEEYNWPGSDLLIPESTYDGFKTAVESMMDFCSHPPSPKHICIGHECVQLGYRRSEMFYNDPDFNGYIRLTCGKKCLIDYHTNCWKDWLKKHPQNLEPEELIGTACLTPDCDGQIELIEVHKADTILKKRIGRDASANSSRKPPLGMRKSLPAKVEELPAPTPIDVPDPLEVAEKLIEKLRAGNAQLEEANTRLQSELENERDHSIKVGRKLKAEVEKEKLMVSSLKDSVQQLEAERDRQKKVITDLEKVKENAHNSNEQVESLRKQLVSVQSAAVSHVSKIKQLEAELKVLKANPTKSRLDAGYRKQIEDLFDKLLEVNKANKRRAQNGEVLYLRTKRNYELYVSQTGVDAVKLVIQEAKSILRRIREADPDHEQIGQFEDFIRLHYGYLEDYATLKLRVEGQFDQQIQQIIRGEAVLSQLPPIPVQPPVSNLMDIPYVQLPLRKKATPTVAAQFSSGNGAVRDATVVGSDYWNEGQRPIERPTVSPFAAQLSAPLSESRFFRGFIPPPTTSNTHLRRPEISHLTEAESADPWNGLMTSKEVPGAIGERSGREGLSSFALPQTQYGATASLQPDRHGGSSATFHVDVVQESAPEETPKQKKLDVVIEQIQQKAFESHRIELPYQDVKMAIKRLQQEKGSLKQMRKEDIVSTVVAGFVASIPQPPKMPPQRSTAVQPQRSMAAVSGGPFYDGPPGFVARLRYSDVPQLDTFDDYVPRAAASSVDSDEPCPICHESLNLKPLAVIDCGHQFHEECLTPWIQKEKTCPMCRKLTLPENEFPRLM